jgi:hypothetical protein
MQVKVNEESYEENLKRQKEQVNDEDGSISNDMLTHAAFQNSGRLMDLENRMTKSEKNYEDLLIITRKIKYFADMKFEELRRLISDIEEVEHDHYNLLQRSIEDIEHKIKIRK